MNIIAPGAIDTDILSGDDSQKRKERLKQIPMGRLGTPDDVAGVVSFLCGPNSSYMTGAILHVNGGLFLP